MRPDLVQIGDQNRVLGGQAFSDDKAEHTSENDDDDDEDEDGDNDDDNHDNADKTNQAKNTNVVEQKGKKAVPPLKQLSSPDGNGEQMTEKKKDAKVIDGSLMCRG